MITLVVPIFSGTPFRIITLLRYISLEFFSTLKLFFMAKKKVSLEIIHLYAAGIDIGSRSHFVAIGQNAEDVKEFGGYNEDLQALAHWLLQNKITSVAMESNGTYWQSLFSTLQQEGLQLILCNGKFTKNIKGKKSDVQDCQWIQKL